MPKLHLVIADNDEAYVESVVGYIAKNYSQRLRVSYFTNYEHLINYFLSNEKKIDILLLCPQWYSESIPMEMIDTPIILSGGILDTSFEDWEIINKYQIGNKLVRNIINCFAENNPNRCYISDLDKKTKVIAVYSPIGGCGKTTIAVGCSINSAERGNSVFYLNLEEIQSTPYFFYCDSKVNISNVLYYIKEKKKNLALKIEGIRNKDYQHDIHYFSPPDTIVDINDTTPDEIHSLIHELKISNSYDEIFIDMSTNMNEKNIPILKYSDQIILVLSHEDLSMSKAHVFMNELDMLSLRNDLDIYHKLTIILNKSSLDNKSKVDRLNINGKSIEVEIPIINEPIIVSKHTYRKELKAEYNDSIFELLRSINQKLELKSDNTDFKTG